MICVKDHCHRPSAELLSPLPNWNSIPIKQELPIPFPTPHLLVMTLLLSVSMNLTVSGTSFNWNCSFKRGFCVYVQLTYFTWHNVLLQVHSYYNSLEFCSFLRLTNIPSKCVHTTFYLSVHHLTVPYTFIDLITKSLQKTTQMYQRRHSEGFIDLTKYSCFVFLGQFFLMNLKATLIWF